MEGAFDACVYVGKMGYLKNTYDEQNTEMKKRHVDLLKYIYIYLYVCNCCGCVCRKKSGCGLTVV